MPALCQALTMRIASASLCQHDGTRPTVPRPRFACATHATAASGSRTGRSKSVHDRDDDGDPDEQVDHERRVAEHLLGRALRLGPGPDEVDEAKHAEER